MLHIVNKSPAQTSALASCLRLAKDGQALLLTEDAVYAATPSMAAISGAASTAAGVSIWTMPVSASCRPLPDPWPPAPQSSPRVMPYRMPLR